MCLAGNIAAVGHVGLGLQPIKLKFQLLPLPFCSPSPPLPGYPNITGMVNTCLLLSSLACRTQRVLKQLFQDTQRFNLPQTSGSFRH